jgi:hypothetical protein
MEDGVYMENGVLVLPSVEVELNHEVDSVTIQSQQMVEMIV